MPAGCAGSACPASGSAPPCWPRPRAWSSAGFTTKLGLPVLLLPLLLAVLRPRALANWAVLAAAVLLAFSVTYRVQIGIRFVLPLVALAAVGLAAAAVQAVRASAAEAGVRR